MYLDLKWNVFLLQVFFEITNQLSHSSACISEVCCDKLIMFNVHVLGSSLYHYASESLERTGGPEEEGVRLFKDELKVTVLKKEENRLGDFADNDFYLVSTLCDPRCILNFLGMKFE